MESWALAYSEINDDFDGYDHPHHHQPVTNSVHPEKTVDKIKAKGELPPNFLSVHDSW